MELGRRDYLTAVLAEYQAIRTEITESSRFQGNLIWWGVSISGAIMTLGVGVAKIHVLVALIALCFLVPTISLSFLEIWIGEIFRFRRAGSYIHQVIEKRLESILSPVLKNLEVDQPGEVKLEYPIFWETMLRQERGQGSAPHMQHLTWVYYTRATLLIFMGFLGLFLGGIHLFFIEKLWQVLVGVALFIFFFLVYVCLTLVFLVQVDRMLKAGTRKALENRIGKALGLYSLYERIDRILGWRFEEIIKIREKV